MTAPPIVWTRDRTPDGAEPLTFGPTCRVCNCLEFDSDMLEQWLRVTRSTEPDEHGRYLVQAHLLWCPTWTDETPELPCPECGAPISTWDLNPGYSVAVPHPVFGTAHMIGTADQVLDALTDLQAGAPKRQPHLDELTVSPCGHVLQGEQSRAVLETAARIRVRRLRAEADLKLGQAKPLLEAADRAGYFTLIAAYENAVRGRHPTAAGLHEALRLVCPDPAGVRR